MSRNNTCLEGEGKFWLGCSHGRNLPLSDHAWVLLHWTAPMAQPPRGPCQVLAKLAGNAYLGRMFSAFEFCLPTKSTSVPNGPDWLHEVKYDGYRLRLERDGDRVRLITRGGHN